LAFCRDRFGQGGRVGLPRLMRRLRRRLGQRTQDDHTWSALFGSSGNYEQKKATSSHSPADGEKATGVIGYVSKDGIINAGRRRSFGWMQVIKLARRLDFDTTYLSGG